MTNYLYTLTALCLIALAGPAYAQKKWNPTQSIAVCTEQYDQQSPAVSSDDELGVVVVWQDAQPDGKKKDTKYSNSVYAKTLSDDKTFAVMLPADANAQAPAIAGRNVVLQHKRGWTNVRLHTLGQNTAKNISGIAYTPSIDGDLIVFASSKHRWEGWTGKGAPKTSWIGDIMAYEIGGLSEAFDITNSDKLLQSNPDVSGRTVVWQESRLGGWGNYGIYKRDIDADSDPVRICKRPGKSAQNPAISGDIIVWQDNRNGNWDIYGYDLKTEKEIIICKTKGDQSAPDIDGRIIVWQDNRSGNYDIYGYDLDTKQVFVVYKGTGNQTEPAICGDTIVWTDDRNGNKDIFMNQGKNNGDLEN